MYLALYTHLIALAHMTSPLGSNPPFSPLDSPLPPTLVCTCSVIKVQRGGGRYKGEEIPLPHMRNSVA